MNASPESPAADRNGPPILEQLRRLLPAQARVLEVGSGWGQHAVRFGAAVPGWEWQPSEQADQLETLRKRCRDEAPPNVLPPIELEVGTGDWPDSKFDVVFSANTAHIMPWPAVCAMIQGAANSLARGGFFVLYGPFNIEGKFTAPSNAAFDQSLRSRDACMGIRNLEALESVGLEHHLLLMGQVEMPANNFLLVFQLQER